MAKRTFKIIFLILVIILIILPFLNTFQEFLTAIFLKIGWYRVIENYLLPFETRMLVLVIKILGFKAVAAPTTISIFQEGSWHKILISWNCIGWQSVIVLFLTFLTGLSGSHSRVSKLQVVLAGILGTFLVNIARITLVAFSIILVPQIPAEVLHNYLSTFITISWLFFFWWFSYSYVLEEKQGKELSV